MQSFRRRAARILLTFALIMTGAGAAQACDARTPCAVEGGEYFMSLPARWNGRDPLPVVVFIHGYNGSADEVMADAPLVRALSDAGVALAAVQGQRDARGVRAWSFPGGQQLPRDDFAFVERVRKDIAARWPVDPARMLASGFSIGGSMVWSIACRTPQLFAGYAPIAGAFWAPEPETCAGPISLRHIHGVNDHTVPMKGRVLRGGAMRQGDVMKSFDTLKKVDACPSEPAQSFKSGALACELWPRGACGSGRELMMCLHDGEHEIEAGWVLDGAKWLAGLAATPAR